MVTSDRPTLTSGTAFSPLPEPGDFLGRCLVGECSFDAELLMPTSRFYGLPKSASYLYGTWRDDEGNLIRALRGVGNTDSDFRYIFDAIDGGQLEPNGLADELLYTGPIEISRNGIGVEFSSPEDSSRRFRYEHRSAGCSWNDGELLAIDGAQVAPGIQWFNPWPGGGCYSATAKYRSSGTVLGRPVQGFVGHEIHYFPPGLSWMDSPYGQGREICWQQIANEYEDGALEQATFAYGADGWGFALLHDEHGRFHSTTELEVDATVRANGFPSRITYRFSDQSWTWTIDPHGERGRTIPGAPLGADGTCVRDGEQRRVLLSMGNSDWWTDGRASEILTEQGAP